MLVLLANPDSPASRNVKINGLRSSTYHIHCGVPQGCPFSPLAFLVVAEALIRLILVSEDFHGITIGNINHRISQFADETIKPQYSRETMMTPATYGLYSTFMKRPQA
jgi:uncharacterized spore protein YtfJ